MKKLNDVVPPPPTLNKRREKMLAVFIVLVCVWFVPFDGVMHENDCNSSVYRVCYFAARLSFPVGMCVVLKVQYVGW